MKYIRRLFVNHTAFSLAVLVLLAAAIVVAVIMGSRGGKEYGLQNTENVPEVSDVYIPAVTDHEPLSGDGRILFILENDKRTDIIACALMQFLTRDHAVSVAMIDPNTQFEGDTLGHLCAIAGPQRLTAAVSAIRDVPIDRYVYMDQSRFTAAADVFGTFEIEIDRSFSYASSDKTYRVNPGVVSADSPMLYAYYQVLAASGDSERIRTLTELLTITCLRFAATADRELLFSSLMNAVDSDITIADHYVYADDMDRLLSADVEVKTYGK